MQRFNKIEKYIALILLDGQTEEKNLIAKIKSKYGVEVSSEALNVAVSNLETPKLIQREGGKLKLNDLIKNEIFRWKEIEDKDSFRLKIQAIIEIQAIEEEFLRKELNRVSNAVQKEVGFTVYSISTAKIIKQDEAYSSFIDLTLSVKDFRALTKFIIFYAPATLEILKPSKITFDAFELQEGLLDLSEFYQKVAQETLKLMNRKELEDFYHRQYKKKEQ